MPDFRAPDGSSQPINNLTVQHLGTVPPFSLAFLLMKSEAAWEQAAVVFINGDRQSQLIGNYHHRNLLWLPSVVHSQHIMLAGWHKRSGPNGGQPWHASRGRVQGEWAEWDDSGGDLDFNDLRVTMVRLPGLHLLPLSFLPLSLRLQLQASNLDAFSDSNAALAITLLANMRSVVSYVPREDVKNALEIRIDEVLL